MQHTNNRLRYLSLVLACFSLPIHAGTSDASGIYTPIGSFNDDSTTEAFFPGASLVVYDPIDPAVGQQIDQEIIKPEIRAPLPRSVVGRGDIAEPPPKPVTENLLSNLGLSLGAIALSTTLDRSGDSFARQHGQNTAAKGITKVGNALPFIAFGLAGLAFLDDDPRLSRTGLAAMQAGGVGAASGLGLKLLFGRSRPELNQGPTQFHATGSKSSDSSMPSIHSAMSWGVITPFAKEYDMPWLYGVAAMTNLARVTDRKHWVSDTVAGSLLGYWLGDIAWHHNRMADHSSSPQVYYDGRNIAFGWAFN